MSEIVLAENICTVAGDVNLVSRKSIHTDIIDPRTGQTEARIIRGSLLTADVQSGDVTIKNLPCAGMNLKPGELVRVTIERV